MRRLSIILLAIVTVFAFYGCGGSEDSGEGESGEDITLIPVVVTTVDAADIPLNTGITVYRAGEKERIVDSFSGRFFELEEGEYDILVQFNGGERLFKNREIKGDEADINLKIPTGILSVRCYGSGGDDIEAEVLIFCPGYDGDIPAYRASTGEEIPMFPGDYDVTVSVQDTIFPRKTVTVSKNEVTTDSFILNTGYIIVSLVDYKGNPVPGEVRVYPAGDYNSSVAAGLTGEKIAVRPGSYDVVATADLYSERSAGISVITNQTSEEKLVTYRYGEGGDE